MNIAFGRCDVLPCQQPVGLDGWAVWPGDGDDRWPVPIDDVYLACPAHLDQLKRQCGDAETTWQEMPFGDFWMMLADKAGMNPLVLLQRHHRRQLRAIAVYLLHLEPVLSLHPSKSLEELLSEGLLTQEQAEAAEAAAEQVMREG